jgi:hypothetical protein
MQPTPHDRMIYNPRQSDFKGGVGCFGPSVRKVRRVSFATGLQRRNRHVAAAGGLEIAPAGQTPTEGGAA